MMGTMASENVALDKIDRQILGIMREDGRIPWQTLGARVHLSPNAAADRVRRMLRSGVIKGFTTVIDQSRLGRSLEAVIDVRVADATTFRVGALSCEEVTSLLHVTGRSDFQVHVACAGTAGLNELLWRFRDEFGAVESHTTVVLERDR
jgi:Lrp/AsnC family leucine-responsive transcriptional regulator